MYIGRIMHTELVTVSPETNILEAEQLLDEKEIDHLLVVDSENKLLGLLSDRDIKRHTASPAISLAKHELNYLLQKLDVSTIMTKTVITVPISTTIERAAYIMQKHHINALPVMDNKQLAGIITSTDVIWVLLKAIGIDDDDARIEIFVRDGIGRLAVITGIFRDAAINISSVICWPEAEHEGITQLVFRVAARDKEEAMTLLQEKGFKPKDHFIKDIREYLPN